MARILVIDDENNVRQMIRLALEHSGHSVDTAVDGSEGVFKFADGSAWDIVLLDHRMPGLSGLDALKQIRRMDPDAKVILITAFGTIDLAIEANAAGATDFLRKPFTADVLRDAVRAAIERPAAAAGAESLPYSLSSINGYRFESSADAPMRSDSGIDCRFFVQGPNLETVSCEVAISNAVVEEIGNQYQRLPGADRFWQGLAGEALANYLWQHAQTPEEGRLAINELTSALSRWVESILTNE